MRICRRSAYRLVLPVIAFRLLGLDVASAQPPRDRAIVRSAGTGTIAGTVLAADTGRPLRRARVRLYGESVGPDGLSVSTDVAGKYSSSTSRPAGTRWPRPATDICRCSTGQFRPFERGTPVQIADRDALKDINFSLPKMSVITGRIVDEANEPVSGATAVVYRLAYLEGHRQLVPAGSTVTSDDAGQYRVLNLPPGTYFVRGTLRETWTVSEGGAKYVLGYAPTYYPGTSDVSSATPVKVGLGVEMAGIDLPLIPGRAASIRGTARDSRGNALAGRTVSLSQEYRGPTMLAMTTLNTAAVGPDGSFEFRNVPPGEYKATVRATVGGSGLASEGAAARVAIDGVDIEDLALNASGGWSLAGTIVTDSGEPPSAAAARFRVRPQQLDDNVNPVLADSRDGGRPNGDWSYKVSGLFGAVRVRVDLPDGWFLKSVFQRRSRRHRRLDRGTRRRRGRRRADRRHADDGDDRRTGRQARGGEDGSDRDRVRRESRSLGGRLALHPIGAARSLRRLRRLGASRVALLRRGRRRRRGRPLVRSRIFSRRSSATVSAWTSSDRIAPPLSSSPFRQQAFGKPQRAGWPRQQRRGV